MRFFAAATFGPALTEFMARAASLLGGVRSSLGRSRFAAAARARLLLRRARAFFHSLSLFLSDAADRFRTEAPSAVLSRRVEVLLLLAGLAIGGAMTAPSAGRFFPAAPWTPRRVALTFDDGPHPAFTNRLLDILRRGGAHATFFVVGSQAERYPALLEAVLRRGCELANHTYDHPPLIRLSRPDLLAELDRDQALLDRAGARGARFFRPPGGRFDARVLSTARGAGYQMVLWTVLPRDHEFPAPDVVRQRVLADVQDGGVILLHSGVESTAEALPALLEELRARGFRCVSVGELLSQRTGKDDFETWLNPATLPRRLERPPEELVEP